MSKKLLVAVLIILYPSVSFAKCIIGDCENGHGTYSTTNGFMYVGEFEQGRYLGQGSAFYPDGLMYVGQWKDGKYHGQGIITYPGGKRVSGLFENGDLVEKKKEGMLSTVRVNNKKAPVKSRIKVARLETSNSVSEKKEESDEMKRDVINKPVSEKKSGRRV